MFTLSNIMLSIEQIIVKKYEGASRIQGEKHQQKKNDIEENEMFTRGFEKINIGIFCSHNYFLLLNGDSIIISNTSETVYSIAS